MNGTRSMNGRVFFSSLCIITGVVDLLAGGVAPEGRSDEANALGVLAFVSTGDLSGDGISVSERASVDKSEDRNVLRTLYLARL